MSKFLVSSPSAAASAAASTDPSSAIAAAAAAKAAVSAVLAAASNDDAFVTAAKAAAVATQCASACGFLKHARVTVQGVMDFMASDCGDFMPNDMRGFLCHYGTDALTDNGRKGVVYASVTLNKGVTPFDMFMALVRIVPNAMPVMSNQ